MDCGRTDRVRLLALDGGGIRGLSELLILEEIMERIKVELKLDTVPLPADYFDLIGGTSTGGLIAILLTRLRLSAAQAIGEYERLAEGVFSHKKSFLLRSDGVFDANRLVDAIKDSIKRAGRDEDALMYDEKDTCGPCKGFVCAVTAPNVTAAAGPTLFRTYRVPKNNSYNCKTWEAARATSAATTVFDRIAIGPPASKVEYLDAGLGYNNPIDLVIEESALVFEPSASVSCIVSLGTGEVGATEYAQPRGLQKLLPTKLVHVLKEIATNCGRKAEEYAKRFSGRDLYFRLNVDTGLEKIPLAEWKDLGIVRAHTQNYMRMDHVSRQIDGVVKALTHPADPRSSVYSLAEIGLALEPKRPRYFLYPSWRLGDATVRRADVFQDINIELANINRTTNGSSAPRCIGLRGIGGSGKSHIALEFCRRAEQSGGYQAIFWIDATSTQTALVSLAAVYKVLFPGTSQRNDNIRLGEIKNAIEEWKSPWLMVFDGLDNFEDFNRNIREYWPMSQFGTILVTSRHRDAELLGEPVKVDKLSDEQAVSLLQAKAGDWGSGYTQEEALQVVQELDSLCLPIVQAAVYIRQHRLTAEGFLTEYHVRQKKILETVPRAALWEYQKRKVLSEDEVRTALSVFTTWELSFQDLTGSKDERTCKVMALSLLAFLGIRSLTDAREIFEKHAASRTTHAEWLVIFKESGVWSSYAFRDVIHEFRDLSLINEVNDSKENPEISMHRIVRDWIQLRLEASSQRAITKEACSMTLSWIEDPQTKEGSWKLDEPYMFKQHALIPMISCVRNCERFLEPGETIGHGDLHDFGVLIFQYFINEGWYEETLALAGPALELSENGLGRWSIQTLELVEVLAVLHRNLGHYAQFHELGQWAFDAIHRVPEEPGNIRLRALMCRLLSLAGQACVEVANYKGGEWCLETAHEGLKQFLGVDHRSTLEAHLALARYYLVARRLNEAMTICALCSAYFDATHLGVMGKARARLLAAEIYLEKRHFVKAYRELQSLRFLCEVCYSPQHPERHRWLHLRGLVEIRRGKFKAAAEMFEHVYQVRKLHLGAQHLDTMQSQTWWARALMELGSFQQSEKILDEAQTTHSGLQTFPHLLFPSPTRLLIELHIMEASSHRRWAEALVPASMAIARFRGGHLLLPASEYPMLLWRTALLTYLALGPHPPFAIEFPGIGVFEPDPKTSLELLMRVAERLDLLDDYTALILFYCTAQNLFALLGDDAAANRYSLKLLETAMRQRSLGMPDGPGEDLSHASALQRPLPSPFATLCNWLIDGPRISRAYLLLGYALQRNGDFDAAQTAYELTPPSWYCDMCPSPETINGPVYICTACSDTALCMPCHGIYHSQEATGHTLASHRAPAGCHGHAFIRVPRDEWQRRPGAQPGTHESKDAIDAWLCRLQAQYSVASFDESASKRLNEFELADAEYRDVADLQPYAAPEIEQELRKGRLERVNGWWHPSGEVPRRAQGNPVLVEPGNLIFVGGVALVGDTVDRDARDGAVFEGSAEE